MPSAWLSDYLVPDNIMGVIARQSTKYSLLNYFGAVIGIVSTLFVYPLALESYGMVRWFIDLASLAAPFVMLGANTLAVRYFPEFWHRDGEGERSGKNSLMGLLLIWLGVGLLSFSLLWWIFQQPIRDFFQGQSASRFAYYHSLLPLTVSVIFGSFFSQYASNYKRIVVPSLLYELLIKLTMPLLILGVVFLSWSLDALVYGVVLNYIIAAAGLFFYLKSLGAFKWMNFHDAMQKLGFNQMAAYALFGIFSSLGAILALRIDRVMVGYMLGDTLNGIFSIVVTLGIFLEIPLRSVLKISAPLVSQAMSAGQIGDVRTIYQRSSLSLMIVGAFLFTGMWWLIDEVFVLMPNGDQVAAGKYVIFFYGLAVWGNMITSVNGEIISYSKFYRLNFYAYLFLAVLNVIMNWLLIGYFGMVGASIATLISLSLFNLLKSGFIWWKFRLQPFTLPSLYTVLLMGSVWLVLSLFSWDFNPWLSFAVKAVFITLAFGVGIIWLNLSPELEAVLRSPLRIIFPNKMKK